MQFVVSSEDQERIIQWLHTEVYPEQIAHQKASGEFEGHRVAEQSWADGYPYDGAIGGGLTYEFTPTSIGVVFKVTSGDKVLDLTNYNDW